MKHLPIILLLIITLACVYSGEVKEGIHKVQEGFQKVGDTIEEIYHKGFHRGEENYQEAGNRIDETLEKGQHRAEELGARASSKAEGAKDYVSDAVSGSVGDTLKEGARYGKGIAHEGQERLQEGGNRAEEIYHGGKHTIQEGYQEGVNKIDESIEQARHRAQEFGAQASHKFDDAKEYVRDKFSGGKNVFQEGARIVRDTARDAQDTLREGVNRAEESIHAGIHRVQEGFGEKVHGVEEGAEKIQHRAEELGTKAGHRVEEGADYIQDKIDVGGDAIRQGTRGVQGTARDAQDTLQEGLNRGGETVHAGVHRVEEGYKVGTDRLSETGERMGHKGEQQWAKAGHRFEDTTDRIRNRLRDIGDRVKEGAEDAYESAKDSLGYKKTLRDKIHDYADSVKDSLHIHSKRDPTIGEKVEQAVDDFKARIHEALTDKVKGAVKKGVMHATGFGAAKHAVDAAKLAADKLLHRKEEIPEEPESKESLKDRIKNTAEELGERFQGYGEQLRDKVHWNRKEEEPVIEEPVIEEPETKATLRGKIEEAFDDFKQRVENLLQNKGSEALKGKVDDAVDAMKEKLHIERKGDENIETPEEGKRGWTDRVHDALNVKERVKGVAEDKINDVADNIKDKIQYATDSVKNLYSKDQPNAEENVEEKVPVDKHEEEHSRLSDLADKIIEGLHKVEDKIMSAVGMGHHNEEPDQLNSKIEDQFKDQTPRMGKKAVDERQSSADDEFKEQSQLLQDDEEL